MNLALPIEISADSIRDFCDRNHIQKLYLFGSILRDDFRMDSDVDVLVEFKTGFTPGLSFFSMQDELAGIVGRPVELCTPACFNPELKQKIMAEALLLHGQD